MILLDWMGNTLRNHPLVKNIVLKLKRDDYEKFRETHILQDVLKFLNFQTRFIEDLSINLSIQKKLIRRIYFQKGDAIVKIDLNER